MHREPHKHIPEQLPGLVVREDTFGQKLNIEKKIGGKGLTAFFGFFSIFWNGVTWTILLTQGKAPLFLYFSHVPIGIITGYVFLAFLLNIQSLSATKGLIEIKSHPLPWTGNKKFNPQNLLGFTTRKYHAYSQNDEPVYKFKVVAIKKNFQSEDVLKGLDTRDHALKVEELLEKFYRMEDNLSHDENKNKAANS